MEEGRKGEGGHKRNRKNVRNKKGNKKGYVIVTYASLSFAAYNNINIIMSIIIMGTPQLLNILYLYPVQQKRSYYSRLNLFIPQFQSHPAFRQNSEAS